MLKYINKVNRFNAVIVQYYSKSSRNQVYIINADGTDLTRLTDYEDGFGGQSTWPLDGTRIAFVYIDNSESIYVINADGSSLTQLTDEEGSDMYPVWLPQATAKYNIFF